MKKCPKCKAEIQEEARFCLYCMTSFEEKQTIETPKEIDKRWLYIIAAVLVLVFIVLGIFLLTKKDNSTNGENDTSSNSSISSDLDASDDNTTPIEQQNSESEGNETSTPTSSNQTQAPSKNKGNTTNNTSNNKTTNNSSSHTSTNNTTTSATSQNSTTSNNTTTNSTLTNSTQSSNKTENNSGSSSTTTTPQPSTTTVTYTYRDAKYGDDFWVGANLENSVVITGVKTVSANGEYKIPDTLDGKKVVAIMALAFCDESISNTVKKVIVPSTVKTIWNNAFANCYNLTDIYFCGNSIYTETYAFPDASKRNGTLTIHCSANCSDRNFRYYKNSVSYYAAEYEEWNG